MLSRKNCFVPDGKLNLLPFDALRDSHGKYVLESHVVSYAPSATVLHLLRQTHRAEELPMSVVGVGGVVYSGNIAGSKANTENSAADLFDLTAGGPTFPRWGANIGISNAVIVDLASATVRSGFGN